MAPCRSKTTRSPTSARRSARSPLDAADPPQRNHRGVLQAARHGLVTRRRGALSRAAQPRSEGLGTCRRLPAQERAAPGRCCAPHVADHHRGGYRTNVIPPRAPPPSTRAAPDEDPTSSSSWSSRSSTIRRSRSATARATPGRRRRQAGLRRLPGTRGEHHQALQDRYAADDDHRRDRHGVSAPQGLQCYGIGPATDVEDGPKGFGAHSDQERILEAELSASSGSTGTPSSISRAPDKLELSAVA